MVTLAVGGGLVLLAWAALRRMVGAAWFDRFALMDLLLPGWFFLLLLGATGRPILSALVLLAMIGGLALVDHVKRDVLREPVVFADRAELLEVVRHPRLYLPFAGTWIVVGGALAAVAAVAGMVWLEPPVLRVNLLDWPALLLMLVASFILPARPPLLAVLARLYARLRLSREPGRDMARFGMFGCFVLQATLARAERERRQTMALARPSLLRPLSGAPIVIVQSESWFDVGRLHPDLRDNLPGLTALSREAVAQGHLSVPAWGANTVRSEFAMLTGIEEEILGLDRFNPYADFARIKLPSLAWHAKAAGYRTVCVHPFDLSFYGRSRVLPLLGFDHLIGPDAFRGAARGGEWVSDLALGQQVARVLGEEQGKVLVFAISMECHGPFDREHDESDPLPPALRSLPQAAMLARYMARLRGADAILPVVADALCARGDHGWLMFYGDHQPSLPQLFDAANLADPRSDYLIWRAGQQTKTRAASRRDNRQDCAAHQLGLLLTQLAAEPIARREVAAS